MSGNIFYRSDPLVICLALMIVLIAAAEIGRRMKKREVKSGPGAMEKADIALIIGGVLTLLALLLGFTYAMSEGRFETRRQLVNRRGRRHRNRLSPGENLARARGSEIRELLRRYTALRVEIANVKEDRPQKLLEFDIRTKQLHGLLWSHAAALARRKPNPITALFLQSLNEMIDLHTKRSAAFRNRVPFSIYLVLFAVSAIALWLAGYYLGERGPRVSTMTGMFALLVAAVMWLIPDLDQPLYGAIRTSQQSLMELHQDLSRDTTKMSH